MNRRDEPGYTIECEVHFVTKQRGRKKLIVGPPPEPVVHARIPRISRLMALAIRFDALIREGHVESMAELARLGHVTRARASQIMNLLILAPDIQEEILHLPPTDKGHDVISEHHLRGLVNVVFWNRQRAMWHDLKRQAL